MPALSDTLRLLGETLIALAALQNSLDVQNGRGAFSPAPPSADVWLTPEEASRRLGKPSRYLSRHWREPGFETFCHRLPGNARGFRVSAAELDAYMRSRR